ncbi:hypothetical protein PC116_g23424 [Phytophthora cactorum]|uniref:Uncharacterized protein n=1 Tax=Phytophthora cactorum TaxID=29920 RepID=A0A8T1JXF2_9STRA|nr:hypothetical protein PC114_g19593 [Phytophthora cactorum]KAG2912634.1 hypothetical protein PC117_g18831 [Phytophthora cactorum]KAG2997372.1 hypothetical protein PC119_g17703 [Phytophthora cactorum]KAG4228210.1 hypothetical protein PC116_g23424 [Phytophthora cactorum]
MRATIGITEEFTEEEQLVQTLVADEQQGDDMQEMPLPNVKALVLAKVIKFCQHHKDAPMDEIQKPLKCNVLSKSETGGPSRKLLGMGWSFSRDVTGYDEVTLGAGRLVMGHGVVAFDVLLPVQPTKKNTQPVFCRS